MNRKLIVIVTTIIVCGMVFGGFYLYSKSQKGNDTIASQTATNGENAKNKVIEKETKNTQVSDNKDAQGTEAETQTNSTGEQVASVTDGSSTGNSNENTNTYTNSNVDSNSNSNSNSNTNGNSDNTGTGDGGQSNNDSGNSQSSESDSKEPPSSAPTQSDFLRKLYTVGLVDFKKATTLESVASIIGNQGNKIGGKGTNDPLGDDSWLVDSNLLVCFTDKQPVGYTGYVISLEYENSAVFANSNVIDLPVDSSNNHVDLTDKYKGNSYDSIKNVFGNGTDGILYYITATSNTSYCTGVQYAYCWTNSKLEYICAVFDDSGCTSVECFAGQ